MKKLIFLSIALNVFLPNYAQKFDDKNHINVEFSQDFGNIFAKSQMYLPGQPDFEIGPGNVRFSTSLLNRSNYYIEPFIIGSVVRGQCDIVNLNDSSYTVLESDLDGNPQPGDSRMAGYYTGTSTAETIYFGGGFCLLKRVSKNFAVGGGFQMSFRLSEFMDDYQLDIYSYTDDDYQLLASEKTQSREAKATSFAWSVPIVTRAYIPVGRIYMTISLSLNISSRAYLSTGVGFSL